MGIGGGISSASDITIDIEVSTPEYIPQTENEDPDCGYNYYDGFYELVCYKPDGSIASTQYFNYGNDNQVSPDDEPIARPY